jgi:hypothetical protein
MNQFVVRSVSDPRVNGQGPVQDLLIVGGGLAGLVAAGELGKAGARVTLIDPRGAWGGYFAGVQLADRRVDAGAVNLEFSAYAPQASRAEVSTYDPERRNDVGRFAGVVEAWARARADFRRMETPRMRVDGVFLPDLLLGGALEALPKLPFAAAASAELRTMADAGSLHARGKVAGAAYDGLDFESASRANHGAVLHERLFGPFVRKVLGGHAGRVLARYHRIPWAPLYWPETLLSVLEGAPPPIGEMPYSYPAGSSVAAIIADLVDEVRSAPGVTMVQGDDIAAVRADAAGGEVQLKGGRTLSAGRIAWNGATGGLVRALGATASPGPRARAPLALVFLTVPEAAVRQEFSILHLVEETAAAYRVTDLTTCAGAAEPHRRLVVELNTDVFAERYGAQPAAEVAAAVARELAGASVLASPEVADPAKAVVAPGGLTVPDRAAVEAWTADRAAIDALAPDVDLLGAAAGFMATSLNDNVVQGLRLADRVLSD